MHSTINIHMNDYSFGSCTRSLLHEPVCLENLIGIKVHEPDFIETAFQKQLDDAIFHFILQETSLMADLMLKWLAKTGGQKPLSILNEILVFDELFENWERWLKYETFQQ